MAAAPARPRASREEKISRTGDLPRLRGPRLPRRTAIFEMLVINDAIREALAKQPKLEVLRQLARQAGSRSRQEEGLVLVARGVHLLERTAASAQTVDIGGLRFRDRFAMVEPDKSIARFSDSETQELVQYRRVSRLAVASLLLGACPRPLWSVRCSGGRP